MRCVLLASVGLVACVLGACVSLHPRTLHEGLQIVVQRVNERSLLGAGRQLDAFVDGERADLSVREGAHTRLTLHLVPKGEADGLRAGRWVIVSPSGTAVPAEARTIAALTNRVFTMEPHVVRTPRALAFVRGLFALVAAVLFVVLARALRAPRG